MATGRKRPSISLIRLVLLLFLLFLVGTACAVSRETPYKQPTPTHVPAISVAQIEALPIKERPVLMFSAGYYHPGMPSLASADVDLRTGQARFELLYVDPGDLVVLYLRLTALTDVSLSPGGAGDMPFRLEVKPWQSAQGYHRASTMYSEKVNDMIPTWPVWYPEGKGQGEALPAVENYMRPTWVRAIDGSLIAVTVPATMEHPFELKQGDWGILELPFNFDKNRSPSGLLLYVNGLELFGLP